MNIKWEQEWDKIYKDQGEVQFDVLPTVRVAAGVFKKNDCKNIMDLGCGTGRHSIYLAQQGFKVYATDISQKGLEITKHEGVRKMFETQYIFNEF